MYMLYFEYNASIIWFGIDWDYFISLFVQRKQQALPEFEWNVMYGISISESPRNIRAGVRTLIAYTLTSSTIRNVYIKVAWKEFGRKVQFNHKIETV